MDVTAPLDGVRFQAVWRQEISFEPLRKALDQGSGAPLGSEPEEGIVETARFKLTRLGAHQSPRSTSSGTARNASARSTFTSRTHHPRTVIFEPISPFRRGGLLTQIDDDIVSSYMPASSARTSSPRLPRREISRYTTASERWTISTRTTRTARSSMGGSPRAFPVAARLSTQARRAGADCRPQSRPDPRVRLPYDEREPLVDIRAACPTFLFCPAHAPICARPSRRW